MTHEEREALEAAGFRFPTLREFLGLGDEEVRIIEERAAARRATRGARPNGAAASEDIEKHLDL